MKRNLEDDMLNILFENSTRQPLDKKPIVQISKFDVEEGVTVDHKRMSVIKSYGRYNI